MKEIVIRLSAFTKKESHYRGRRKYSDDYIYHGQNSYSTIIYTSGTLDGLTEIDIDKLVEYFSESKWDPIEDEFYGSPTEEVFDERKTEIIVSILNFILPYKFEKSTTKCPICCHIKDSKMCYDIVSEEFMSDEFDNSNRLNLIANLINNNQNIQNEIINKWLIRSNFSSNEELLEYLEKIKELKIEIKGNPLASRTIGKVQPNNNSNNSTEISWEEIGRDELRSWDESYPSWQWNID
jgi:hypothetical protein